MSFPAEEAAQRLLRVTGQLVQETHPGRRAPVVLDSPLERDLGLDSLARVELMLRLGREFGVALPEAALGEAETPRDLLRFLGHAAPAALPQAAIELPHGAVIPVPDAAATLVEVLEWHAARSPDRTHVLLYGEGEQAAAITYADLLLAAHRVAAGLVARGLQPQQAVALMLPTGMEYLTSFFGVLLAGGIPVPIYPPARLAQIDDHLRRHARILDNAQAVFIVTVPQAKGVAALLRARVPSLAEIVTPEEIEAEPAPLLYRATPDDIAFLQYTSGTTGDPKGVLYSHRSNVLHALQACMKDTLSVSAQDSILPIVPMFHANAWSLAFSVPLAGAKFVMPGAKLDGASVYELLETEKVTFSAAVPTVWLMLMQHMQAHKVELHTLQRVAIGGSACPPSMIEYFEERGVTVYHAWGMTEMSPIGTIGAIKPALGELKGKDLMAIKAKQGHGIFAVEMKITDDEDNRLPWDGVKFGRLKVRGPAIARRYFKREDEEILDAEGFFDTGDVATIDPNGYMQITDRAKDVIKSGGEWISSIDLENIAVGHPQVAEAAVIGVLHPKWDERPLLIIVPKEGQNPGRDDILKYMDGKIAKWWMPDAVVFIDAIPLGATGKNNKLKLREMHAAGELNEAA
mgnify:CR=1 FL=1